MLSLSCMVNLMLIYNEHLTHTWNVMQRLENWVEGQDVHCVVGWGLMWCSMCPLHDTKIYGFADTDTCRVTFFSIIRVSKQMEALSSHISSQKLHVITQMDVLMHYNDVIMGSMASQITSLIIVYSAVYFGAYQRKHQSSASLAFVRGINRGPVNSPHKWPITRKMFPFDDVLMIDGMPCLGVVVFLYCSQGKSLKDYSSSIPTLYTPLG